jgi:cytochrome b subunit of formate dehydrogenase
MIVKGGIEGSRMARLTAVVAVAFVLLASGMAHAVEPSRPASARAHAGQDCLMCHALRTLERSSGKGTPLFVDRAVLAASVHAGVACADCHRGATLSHPERLPAVRCAACHASERDSLVASAHGGSSERAEAGCRTCHGTHDVSPAERSARTACASCHADVAADYQESIHGRALADGDPEASTCNDCHGPVHSVRSHLDPRSSTSHGRQAATCGGCHADRALMQRRKITIPEAVLLFRNSVHGRSKDPRAAVCSDCHESHRLRRATDPTSSIYRTNIPSTCGRCHAAEAQAYRGGIHGIALRAGVTASPVCTDCHGEHLIRGPRELGSPVASAGITETCSRCHEATGIRETYGLPAGRLSSYRDSFHGLAARGGSPAVANCASCHGFHDILPSSDPRSAISKQRLPETCGKCHPGAGARFAMGPVHVAMATPDQPVLYWTRRVYLWLIGLTIGFMLLHNGLDFRRKIARAWGEHLGRLLPHAEAATRWFERMTRVERLQHALLAASFFVLAYTGFALKFPEAWPFAWFARLEHGYRWRSSIHRWAAVVMIAVSLFHVGTLFARRGREFLLAMVPRVQDAVDLVNGMLHLVGLRAAPPRFDRFGYIEKLEYWALIWGTVVMSATGLVLWFENESLKVVSKWVLDLATLVHYYEAWLAFLAIVVWHLYQNIVNPDVYPMNWSWASGRISEAQLKHEHALEWERLIAAEREPEPEPEPETGTREGEGEA